MGLVNRRVLDWVEAGRIPDVALRFGVRHLLSRRLADINAHDVESASVALDAFVAGMRRAEIAPLPERANEQHYEVPASFFDIVLGRHQKYSCAYWAPGERSLDEAEASALRMTCERAGIEDGMSILELGCGWGSLTLWIAKHYPGAQLTAVSNSASQREHIESLAARDGLSNLNVITCDMNDFEASQTFDRIVSVEMFEHMRNYEELFARIHRWLKADGQFFMHIFCHRLCAYPFEDNGPQDWMSRHFFSGGIMPSVDLPLHFQRDLTLRRRWVWDGQHYEKTANAWLAKLDANNAHAMPVLAETYGAPDAQRWLQRWRMFFIACAELFGYNEGQEWFVGHYLFVK